MDLATYLREANERPSAFARRIGAKPSTISGWMNDPARGPSRAMLVRIEEATGGQVTAKDFAPSEQSTGGATGASHDAVLDSRSAQPSAAEAA